MSGLQERDPARPGLHGAAARATSRSTSPRCSATRAFTGRCASEVLPAAAHLSVHPHLGRGLLDRGGGRTRWRSRCTRRGCSSARGSTRPTWTRTCWPARAAGRVRAGARCATTRGTTCAAGGTRGVRALLHRRRRRAPTSIRRCCEHGRLRPAQPRHRPLVQRVQLIVICRNVLIYFGRDLQDRVLRLFDESLRAAASSRSGARRRSAARAIEDRYEAAGRGREDLPDGHDAAARARRHRRLLGRPARGRARSSRALPRGLPPRRSLVAQHRAEDADDLLAGLLGRARRRWPCARSRTRTRCSGAGVLVAPADYHLLVERRPLRAVDGRPRCASAGPSIDVLLGVRRRRATATARSASC